MRSNIEPSVSLLPITRTENISLEFGDNFCQFVNLDIDSGAN